MYWSIRSGNDGIGNDFDFGVFADSLTEAREEAADSLRAHGYGLQADKGLYTVHGHPAWLLSGNPIVGYRIVPLDQDDAETMAKTSRVRNIITIDADAYAERIDDFVNNRPKLTSAEIAQLDQDIEDTFDRMLADLRELRGEDDL